MAKNLVIALLTVAIVLASATLLVQSQTEWQSDTSVQIAARPVDDGRVEFGLRHRQGDGWSDLILPDQRFVDANSKVDDWRVSDEIAVPAASVRVHLREGVHVGDYQDEFLVFLDDHVYETNCGYLSLKLHGISVLLHTLDEDCEQTIGLATVCGSAESECDTQQAMIYMWENNLLRRYGHERIELSLGDAQAIVAAVYGDYLGANAIAPTVRRAQSTLVSRYDSVEHEIVLAPGDQNLYVVLHETIHAIIVKASSEGSGHDQYFAAQTLDAWKRYLPTIDSAGARVAAREHRVAIADTVPVPAIADGGVSVLWALICTDPVRSKSYCDALSGSMRAPHQVPSLDGEVQAVMTMGRIDDRRWYGAEVRDGSLFTWLIAESSVLERPELVARFRVVCHNDTMRVDVWWQLTRGTSDSVLLQFGDGEFTRDTWKLSDGSWSVNDVEEGFRVVFKSGKEAEELARELLWAAAAGETVTIQIRSGRNPLTATFDLDGLFDTPVQSNLATCGR